jgi:uncharacterized membrane protein
MVTKYFVQYWGIEDEQAALIVRDAISRTYGFTVGQNLFTVVANDIVPTGIGVGYTIGQYLLNSADNNIIIAVGGQGANPFFAKLANSNLINRIQYEGQATIEIEENYKYGSDLFGMPMYVKKIYAVAGWSVADTLRAANYIAANGLPMVSLTVPSSAVQLLAEVVAVPTNQTAPVGSTVSASYTATVTFAANAQLNTESNLRGYIESNIQTIANAVNTEMKRQTSSEVYVKSVKWSFYPDYAATLTAQNYSKPIGHIDFELIETASPFIFTIPIILAILAAITLVTVSLSLLGISIVSNATKQKLIEQGTDAQQQITTLTNLYAQGKISKAEYDTAVEAIKSTYEATAKAVGKEWTDVIPLILIGAGVLVVLWFALPMITKKK